jgi:hypothetical protein
VELDRRSRRAEECFAVVTIRWPIASVSATYRTTSGAGPTMRPDDHHNLLTPQANSIVVAVTVFVLNTDVEDLLIRRTDNGL